MLKSVLFLASILFSLNCFALNFVPELSINLKGNSDREVLKCGKTLTQEILKIYVFLDQEKQEERQSILRNQKNENRDPSLTIPNSELVTIEFSRGDFTQTKMALVATTKLILIPLISANNIHYGYKCGLATKDGLALLSIRYGRGSAHLKLRDLPLIVDHPKVLRSGIDYTRTRNDGEINAFFRSDYTENGLTEIFDTGPIENTNSESFAIKNPNDRNSIAIYSYHAPIYSFESVRQLFYTLELIANKKLEASLKADAELRADFERYLNYSAWKFNRVVKSDWIDIISDVRENYGSRISTSNDDIKKIIAQSVEKLKIKISEQLGVGVNSQAPDTMAIKHFLAITDYATWESEEALHAEPYLVIGYLND